MADVIYKMFGTVVAATTNSISSIDVQDDGFIEGVYVDLVASGMDALNDTVRMELGFASNNTFSVNDVRSSIITVCMNQQFLTSGGGAQGKSVWIAPPGGIRINAGERIHLHGEADTGVTLFTYAYLYAVITARRRVARRNR